MRKILAITKALSDENRVRALMVLSRSELCVCQIIELLELAPSTVSKHMSILKQAGLVESSKVGRWMNYRLAKEDPAPEVDEALSWLRRSLGKSKVVKNDAKRLKQILKQDREIICQKQYKK